MKRGGCKKPSVDHHISDLGQSVENSIKIFKEDNLINNEKCPIPFSCLCGSFK